jgi:hypothetical protein
MGKEPGGCRAIVLRSREEAPRRTPMVGRAEIILVVTALAPVLRGWTGRNAGANDDTTRHLWGRSVRALAFGLALLFPASRMTTRERGGGKPREGGAHGTDGATAGGVT